MIQLLPAAVLVFCGAALAQTPITVQFGASYCAAVQRPPQVQSYCYAWPGPPWVLVHNQTDSVPVSVSWRNGSDAISWQFDAVGGYSYTTDGNATITSGTFGGTQTTTVTAVSMACDAVGPTTQAPDPNMYVGDSTSPGGQQSCTITLNQAPISDVHLMVCVPLPLVGPGGIVLTSDTMMAVFEASIPRGASMTLLPVVSKPWIVQVAGR